MDLEFIQEDKRFKLINTSSELPRAKWKTKLATWKSSVKDDFQSVPCSLSPQCLWASHEGMWIDVIR